MAALHIARGGELSLNTVPIPVAMGDQALIRTQRAGVCNTDLELRAGYFGFEGTPGHEFVGEVVAVGNAVAEPRQWIGRRVVGEINVACGRCDLCVRGIPSQCRDRVTVGIDRHDGAFAEYLALTTRNLYLVPDSVSDDAAAFVEPLAAAFQILEAVQISPRDRVVLIGAGKLGLLCAQVLRLTGAEVIGVVRRPEQAYLLEGWGIAAQPLETIERERAQVVVDCTGAPEGFAAALDLVEPRGAIVLKSTYVGTPTADLTRIAVNEIRVIGSRCGSFAAALRALAMGVIDVAPLIEARYPLAEGVEAFTHAARPGTLKIMLEMG